MTYFVATKDHFHYNLQKSFADKPTHSSHTDQTFEEDLPGPSKLKITAEFPQLEAPLNIHDFVYEMGNVPYIVNIPKDFFHQV